MKRLPPLAAAVMVSVLLPACSMLGADSDKMPAGQCHAAGARDQLGKIVDEHVLADARAGSTALRSRIVPYGASLPASDVDPMRLNVEVETEAGGGQRIKRLRCG